ncbi:MAG: hypothetical protein AAGE05_06545 [Pseudomonadota bacterium]
MRKTHFTTTAIAGTLLMLAGCSGGGETAEGGEDAAAGGEEAAAETYDNGIPMYSGVDAAEVEIENIDGERRAEFTIEGSPFAAIDFYGPQFTANGWENGAGTADMLDAEGNPFRTLNAATGSDGTVRVTIGAVGGEAGDGMFENGVPAYANVIEGSVNASAGAGDMQNVTFDTNDTVLAVMNFYTGAFEEAGAENRMLVYTAGNQGDGPGGRITVNRTNTVRITYFGAE